jgi:hypothetical protein
MIDNNAYDAAFNLFSSSFRDSVLSNEEMGDILELRDSSLSTVNEAAAGISIMIQSYPTFFVSEASVGKLSGKAMGPLMLCLS